MIGTRQIELPLGEVALAAPVDGGVAVVLPGEAALSFYSMAGERVGYAARDDLEPMPVTEDVRDQILARAIDEADPNLPVGLIERDLWARLALLADDHVVPAFDRILVSNDGRSVWLREYALPADEAAPSTWSVYGLDGSVQAIIPIPAGFRPTQVRGDRIAGVLTDPLGVEYAAVYAVEIR